MKDLDQGLYMIEQIHLAQSPREIAGYLLRTPDAIVLSHGLQLQVECSTHSFEAGVQFLNHRVAALQAVRDAHGLIPESIGIELELWRFTFSRFAAGQRRELPAEFSRGTNAPAKI